MRDRMTWIILGVLGPVIFVVPSTLTDNCLWLIPAAPFFLLGLCNYMRYADEVTSKG